MELVSDYLLSKIERHAHNPMPVMVTAIYSAQKLDEWIKSSALFNVLILTHRSILSSEDEIFESFLKEEDWLQPVLDWNSDGDGIWRLFAPNAHLLLFNTNLAGGIAGMVRQDLKSPTPLVFIRMPYVYPRWRDKIYEALNFCRWV